MKQKYVFLEFSCFFYVPLNVDNLISGSSAFSKSSLNIWKFSVHILPKPSLKNFEHNLTTMWNEWNCKVVWAFFGIAFLWSWNENWPFQVLGHCWVFQICPQFFVIQTVKSFGIVNKARIDVFLELSCFLWWPSRLTIWSLVPLPFLKPAWTSGSSQFTYCWSLAWRILNITLLSCEMRAIVQ